MLLYIRISWLFLVLLEVAGCQQTTTSRPSSFLSDTPYIRSSPRIHYADMKGAEGMRWRVLVARFNVTEGHPLAPRFGALKGPPVDPPDEARIVELEPPFRIITQEEVEKHQADLAGPLEEALELAPLRDQAVTISHQRDFVYPKRFHTADHGAVYQTLTTEKMGYEITLTWKSKSKENGEPAILDLSYSESQLDTFEKNTDGHPLPLIRRERLSKSFQIERWQMLLFGSQRAGSSRENGYQRRAIWIVPVL
jgi:hypothetical protein